MDRSITVGQLASERPYSIPVLQRHRLDFCCGGSVPLADACARRGIDLDGLLREVEEARPPGPDETDWTQEPLDRLTDHIVTRYHRALDAELPRLCLLADKVARVHGTPQLIALRQEVHKIASELASHMRKEEQVLFPWIASGRGAAAGAPIRVMQLEHDDHATSLHTLRSLTDDYQAPPKACGSWRALWYGLSELDRELQEHIHLENNVLFPRALTS